MSQGEILIDAFEAETLGFNQGPTWRERVHETTGRIGGKDFPGDKVLPLRG
jgi:hypothetical protein